MSGWDVSVLQFLLTRRGFSPGAIEGHFGPATQCALRSYQRSAHLVPDGVMGAVTLAALGRGLHVPLAPSPAVARPRYVVRTGDTLTTIASRYRTTPGAIARANGLDVRGVLPVGTKLRVPALAASAPAAESLTPEGVQAAIDYWAGYYGVSVSLARALAWMESGYQTAVRSPVGAWGVMQVLPETWAFAESVLIGVKVPRTAEGNIRVGIAYLHHLLNEFGGDTRLALGGWYQGPRAVREHGLFPETRAFVADVLALEERM
jgi:soluble lytic murein transglycosylase-like protein